MNRQKIFQFARFLPISKLSARFLCSLLLWTCLGGNFTSNVRAGEAPPLQMLAVAPVSTHGIFLPQFISSTQPLPAIHLGDAPAFGKDLILTGAQICDFRAANAPGVGTSFSGPDAITIYRRARTPGNPAP